MVIFLIRHHPTKECIQRNRIIIFGRIKWRKTEMSP